MPLYEYHCDACHHRFELIQKFSDLPAETCPKCGGQVRKLPSSPAIQFKGTGWYITDYARKGTGDTTGGKAGASEGGAGSSSTTDAKGGEKKTGDASSSATPSTSDTKS